MDLSSRMLNALKKRNNLQRHSKFPTFGFIEYKNPLFIHFQVDDACDVDSKMLLGVVFDQSGVKIDCDKQCYVDEAIYE